MSLNITEQIEKFLLGQLNQEEYEAFEKALISDQSLREEVSFRKLAIKGTKLSGKNELKDRLKKIHNKYESNSKSERQTKKINLWTKWIGVAASFTILITSGLFLFNNNEFDTQIAFEKYYKPAPLRLASRDLNAEKTILQLNEYYNNNEYDKALPFFQKFLAIDSTNSRIRLGAGICHLELNQLNLARTQFLSIIKVRDFRLQFQASWYMALTYLKEGNLEEAQKYLDPIINNSKADHYEHAKEIMDQLNNL